MQCGVVMMKRQRQSSEYCEETEMLCGDWNLEVVTMKRQTYVVQW